MHVTLCPGTRVDIKVQGDREPSLAVLPYNPTETTVLSLSPFHISHFCSCYFPLSSSASSPVPSSRSPSLTHTICPKPPTLSSIVSPMHVLSTPPVSLLAASHWDHTAAEVWRQSQWSVTHKDVHIHPSPLLPSTASSQ